MRADFEARLKRVRDREKRAREKLTKSQPVLKKRKDGDANDSSVAVDEEQFILDDYQSDEDSLSTTKYSNETTKLMETLGMLPKASEQRDDQETIDELKIFFCSRTHSQLSQFTGELQRVKLPPGIPPEDESDESAVEELKHLTLGSRKNLCINPKVVRLPTQTAINERCIELQQSSSSAAHKCSFLPKKDSEDLTWDFRDHALSRIRDIEDLAKLGEQLQICPYYASRPAIGPAEVITLPYPLLLQKSAREALGISMKGHIVIIDEAHNILNAVEGIYSAELSNDQLKRVRDVIIIYLQKFRNRLKGSNRVYVTQLVRVIDSLLEFTKSTDSNTGNGVTSANALLSGKGVDQINLTKLVNYISESKLARKVEGYATHLLKSSTSQNGPAAINTREAEVPTLMQVQSFLMTLMNPSKEGRFFWSRESDKVILRYMLLDPSEHFRDIVSEARAVILAGGTMSPMDEYKHQLFPYLPSVFTFSCGHLIPPTSLLVRTISTDDDGRIEFSFKSRNRNSAVRIGKALSKISICVKGGTVVFFPSYGYLEEVLRVWKEDSILDTLQSARRVFSDGRKSSAEDTFRAYSEEIRTKGSAVLLSVVGGKLSEGINFSDDLGRCVVVVGLPYPNLQTADWKAKMQYLEDRATANGEPRGQASKEHAENVCMRSVNQAIGRAIRHKNDWASILLFDARFDASSIQNKLPAWIKVGAPAGRMYSLRDTLQDLKGFFDTKAITTL